MQWEKVLGEYGGQDLYPIRFTFERAGNTRPQARFADVVTVRADDADDDGVARRPAVIGGAFDDDGVTLTASFRTDVVTGEWMRGLLERCLTVLANLCTGTKPAS